MLCQTALEFQCSQIHSPNWYHFSQIQSDKENPSPHQMNKPHWSKHQTQSRFLSWLSHFGWLPSWASTSCVFNFQVPGWQDACLHTSMGTYQLQGTVQELPRKSGLAWVRPFWVYSEAQCQKSGYSWKLRSEPEKWWSADLWGRQFGQQKVKEGLSRTASW